MQQPRILIIGTGDTKGAELQFICEVVRELNAIPRFMDIGILGEPQCVPEYSREEVALAAGTNNQSIANLGDENLAIRCQAKGARLLTLSLLEQGDIDGVLVIGGTMATDLGLEVTSALPLGFPKMLVSTIAFSPLLPPERIAPDTMMALWAGGLYGLNSISLSVLRSATTALVGVCRSAKPQATPERPMIGITSLGGSSLRYMKPLTAALSERGFDTPIFHTTGMGGMAFESLLESDGLVAALDFCLVEVSNHLHGSPVSSGARRLETAGKKGIPQIVAPGGVTLLDFPAWAPAPQEIQGREVHVHNRLIACAKLSVKEKMAVASEICRKLAAATGPTAFILPLGGIDEWDREGQPFHDPEGFRVFCEVLAKEMPANVEFVAIDAHINDSAFVKTALAILDRWSNDNRLPISYLHA